MLQLAPAAQSTGPAQGKAHFWNWTLQRASPHDASLVHGNAKAPGVAIVPAGAAPAGAGATGAGVAAVTAGWGWGRGWVGAGGVYGAGAAAGGSSLAHAQTIEAAPARAMKDLRSIEFFSFRAATGACPRGSRFGTKSRHPNREFVASVQKRICAFVVHQSLPSAGCQEYVRFACSAPSGSLH